MSSMNKAAVIVCGLSEKDHDYSNLIATFPPEKYDIYLQSWNIHRLSENPHDFPVVYSPIPDEYNAYVKTQFCHPDIPEMQWNPEYEPDEWTYWGYTKSKGKSQTGHYGVYAFAQSIAMVEEHYRSYEVYVKTRYDCVHWGNFLPYVENVLEKPCNVHGFQNYSPRRTPNDTQTSLTRLDVIDRFKSKIMSDKYLCDFVLIFNRRAWNIEKVLDVCKDQNIIGAEFGWGQCLGHLSSIETIFHKYIGGVTLKRWQR